MSVGAAERRAAEQRADGRCEYCRMHQELQGAAFHVEHTEPTARGGADDLDNLALACPTCNLKKGARVTGEDPATGMAAGLFNPRRHQWSEHFVWSGLHAVGRTPTGRATVLALDLNHPRRLRIRVVEQALGLFPPPGS